MAARRSPLSPVEPGLPSTPCRRRESRPRGAAPAHQQRQRLSRPSQAMAQPLQRRRHQEPAQLSRLAARSRSLGRQTRTAKLDQRRYRKRAIPTDNAIRAKQNIPIFRNPCYQQRLWTEWNDINIISYAYISGHGTVSALLSRSVKGPRKNFCGNSFVTL